MKTRLRIPFLCALLCLGSAIPGWTFYNPTTGRWLTRDPLADEAFLRQAKGGKPERHGDRLRQRTLQPLYLFVANSPIKLLDLLGLLTLEEVANLAAINRPAGLNDQITPFTMICLLWKESNFNPNATNPNSSARGIAQILNGTADDIQDRLGPRWGGSDPFYSLGRGERLRDHRDDPNVSVFSAYIYIDDRLNARGTLQGALEAYGPDATAITRCADCFSRNCGIRFNSASGRFEVTNPTQAQNCLHLIHR